MKGFTATLPYADTITGGAWQHLQPDVDRLLQQYGRAANYGQQAQVERRLRKLLQRNAPEVFDLAATSAFIIDKIDTLTNAGQTPDMLMAVEALISAHRTPNRAASELPLPVRSALEAILPRIEQPLQIGRTTLDPEVHAYCERIVTRTLETEAQLLLHAVDAALESQGQTILGGVLRSGNDREFGTPPQPTRESGISASQYVAPPLVRYTNITCPRKIWIETRRVGVIVQLTREPDADSEATTSLQVVPGNVSIRLYAPGFKQIRLEKIVDVTAEGDSTPAIFYLRPNEVGEHQLSFEFWQAGNLVGTVALGVEITTHEVSLDALSIRGQLTLQHQAAAADVVLRIRSYQKDGQAQLIFEASFFGELGAYESKPRRLAKHATLEHYIDDQYTTLTLLRQGNDPLGATVPSGGTALTAELINSRLRDLGQNLWRDLVPQQFKEIYEERRAELLRQDKPLSLCIISDETIVPWELLWPNKRGAWHDEGPWCTSFHMARWLPRASEDDDGVFMAGPPGTLPFHSVAILTPTFPDRPLEAGNIERNDLLRRMQAWQIQDCSPSSFDEAQVRTLLETGGFAWLHLVTHGQHVHQHERRIPLLWLQGSTALNPGVIIGKVADRISVERPAFVFHACDLGRGNWDGIVGYESWAERLIGAGAGLFLAPLWEVTDRIAPTFSAAFYDALFRGETVAAAVYAGRRAIQRDDDPTWLAYSLYAHPNARIRLPGASLSA
jgi:hypothetical protein